MVQQPPKATQRSTILYTLVMNSHGPPFISRTVHGGTGISDIAFLARRVAESFAREIFAQVQTFYELKYAPAL